MPVTESAVLAALSKVQDPELHRDLVSLNMVQDIAIEGDAVSLKVILTTPACPLRAPDRDGSHRCAARGRRRRRHD